MTFAVLVIGSILVFAAMIYLTLAVNEFERKTTELAAILEERYTLPLPQKKNPITGQPRNQAPAKP